MSFSYTSATKAREGDICIALERPKSRYFPGDTVAGQLRVLVPSNVCTREIIVILVAILDNHAQKSIGLEGTPLYRQELKVWSPSRPSVALQKARKRAQTLVAGNHLFDFSFDIPTNQPIPSAFESEQYKLRWEVQGYQMRLRGPPIYAALPIHVQDRIDVSSLEICSPSLLAVPLPSSRSFLFPPRRRSPATVLFGLTATAFRPGDPMPMTLQLAESVKSPPKPSLLEVRVELRRRTSYHVQGHSDIERLTLMDESLVVEVGSENQVSLDTLRLPQDLYPTNLACDILQVTYKLRLHLRECPSKSSKPSGPSTTFRVPVTIGTYDERVPEPMQASHLSSEALSTSSTFLSKLEWEEGSVGGDTLSTITSTSSILGREDTRRRRRASNRVGVA